MTAGILNRLRAPSWRDVFTVEFGDRLGDLFLLGVAFILAGYAIGGRGFAYIGLPPLFIGEATLLLGLLAFCGCRRWKRLLADARVWPLVLFCTWGACRTAPYLSEYKFDAVRDAVVWIYAAFAFVIMAVLTEHPRRLAGFVLKYRAFVPWFLLCIPVWFAITRLLGSARPEWPWAGVPVITVKEGDVLVHLGGVLAFWTAGLGRRPGWPMVVLLTAITAMTAVVDRAGTVAFGVAFVLSLLYRPKTPALRRVVTTLVVAVAVLWVTDLHIPLTGGKNRDISFDQVVTNLGSVVGDAGSDGLDSTKEWRLNWWKEIVRYTVHGPYFFSGKGYGINLADDDGFQVLADGSLRNPHNVTMDVLARSGVPGLCTWAFAHGFWALLVGYAFLRSGLRGQREWNGLFFFLFCYWAALMVNGSFDVFIEGPPGGIWLWSVYGTGLAAVILYDRDPGLLTADRMNAATVGAA